VEGGSSLAKMTQKQALVEAKEIQKMLKWIWMASKKRQWGERTDLGGLFVVHLIIPWPDLLEEFLHT
jgi:hypothetical protein